jgi:ribonuclease III
MSLDQLQRKLGYTFRDSELLALALTHRSYGDRNNERLEFLGDAALGLVVSQRLYGIFPAAREQELTLMRAGLVKGESLTEIARGIGLGDHLRLGIGERRSGGHQRPSILANALEAVIGAVLQDGGIEAAADVVERLFRERFDSGRAGLVEKDAKTRLQELLQSRRLELPEYRVMRQEGDAHEPLFTVECAVAALGIYVEARASNRRDAEKQAAQLALDLIQDTDHG